MSKLAGGWSVALVQAQRAARWPRVRRTARPSGGVRMSAHGSVVRRPRRRTARQSLGARKSSYFTSMTSNGLTF